VTAWKIVSLDWKSGRDEAENSNEERKYKKNFWSGFRGYYFRMFQGTGTRGGKSPCNRDACIRPDNHGGEDSGAGRKNANAA
jgi:hypothetical protein